MQILVLNAGSSSLKVCLVEATGADAVARVETRSLARGTVTGIGGEATVTLQREGSAHVFKRRIGDHAAAFAWGFEGLDGQPIDAVGHRVVHGGRYRTAVVIDGAVAAEIERLSELAPLHNPPCLQGIAAARAALGPGVPMVAVFDTAFHRTLPERAASYALPETLVARHGIRRYGFHGIAHASLAAGYEALTGRPLSGTRLITLHLGNGCSATAICDGRSVETSMGFTPLEGLVMGTRSGDLDPAVVPYLVRREGVSADDVERWLNERSGLLGVSGLSSDMARLLAAAEQDRHPGAQRAIDLFCYRVRQYVGAYLAVLGGADAVVFGGGIGERAPAIRASICEGLAWCGLRLDAARNAAAADLAPGAGARVSRDDSALAAYVVAVDEESWIARETARCVTAGSRDA